MPTGRIAMNVIEQVLRLPHVWGRSQREIGSACGLSIGAVNGLLQRAEPAGLGWPLPAGLDGDGLKEWLHGKPSGRWPDARRAALDFAAMHTELSRRGARGASVRVGAGGEFVLLRGSELGPGRGELARVARVVPEFFGGSSEIVVPGYVPGNIIRVMRPSRLCALRPPSASVARAAPAPQGA